MRTCRGTSSRSARSSSGRRNGCGCCKGVRSRACGSSVSSSRSSITSATTPILSIRTANVERFRDKLLTKVAASTVGHRKRALSLVLRLAVKRKVLLANPMDGIEWSQPREQRTSHHSFEAIVDIVRRIRESGEEGASEDADFVTPAAQTGLRPTELERLTVEDIDVAGCELFVADVLQRLVAKTGTGPLSKALTRSIPTSRSLQVATAPSTLTSSEP